MKNITLSTLVAVFISVFMSKATAQDGYTYTLTSDGFSGSTYNFTVQAVPLVTSTSNYNTQVQSYGFTILIPDGATLNVIPVVGSNISSTSIPSSSITSLDAGTTGHQGFLLSETLGSPVTLSTTPASLTPVSIATLQVGGNPTYGEIRIVANNSTLGTSAGGALKAFMSADMIDDAIANFPSVIDANASGLSGSEHHSFSSLAIQSVSLKSLVVYPNPNATGAFYINGLPKASNIKVFGLNGQLLLEVPEYTEGPISTANLASGVYMLQIDLGAHQTVKKLVIDK